MPLLTGRQRHVLSLEGVNMKDGSSGSLIRQSALRLHPQGCLGGWWYTALLYPLSLQIHPQVIKWQSWLKSKTENSSFLVHFLISVDFYKATPTPHQYLQHILRAAWGILSEPGPDAAGSHRAFGEKDRKSKQQPLCWLTFQNRRAFQSPGHLTRERRFQCNRREASNVLQQPDLCRPGERQLLLLSVLKRHVGPAQQPGSLLSQGTWEDGFCIFLLLKPGQPPPPPPRPLVISKVLANAKTSSQRLLRNLSKRRTQMIWDDNSFSLDCWVLMIVPASWGCCEDERSCSLNGRWSEECVPQWVLAIVSSSNHGIWQISKNVGDEITQEAVGWLDYFFF